MLEERELTTLGLSRWVRLRTLLFYGAFVALAWTVSDAALSRGQTTTILLLIGLVCAGFVALIFWRPVIGLYGAVFLNVAMDPAVAGDPISKYTGYAHLDLNTFAHAGIAFNPIELVLIVTTLAYLLRAVSGSLRLRGGSLGRHVLIFALFLIAGYVWGFATHGDPKIGLFEVRGPFMLVLLYFLVTNLVVERRQVVRLVATVILSIAVIDIWSILRLELFLHGNTGGPDGVYGSIHEDAVFLAFLIVIILLRFLFSIPLRNRRLLVLLPPAIYAIFEMQRRAAWASLFFAVAVLAIALYHCRRRLFFVLVPPLTVLLVVYAAAFWNSSSRLAQPIRAWRSQTTSTSLDQRDYDSNQYRINEKADVRDTILSSPILGIGFGHQFLETHPLVVLSWWPFQFYTPHAEILWIWLKVGAGGFIAFWVLMCTTLLRAGDLVRRAGSTPLGYACLVAAIYIVMLLVFAYVDVGLAGDRPEVLLGTMVGIIGTVPRLLEEKKSLGITGPRKRQQIEAGSLA